MPPDKRRWTTEKQDDFLLSRFPAYLEAQAARNYTRFWPSFFQDWFALFPVPDPSPDYPTDSEENIDDDDDDESDASSPSSPSSQVKRKRKSKKKPKKRVKTVSIPTPVMARMLIIIYVQR